MWVGTDGDGLFQFEGGKVRNYRTQDGLASNQIRTILCDRRGGLWIGTFGGVSRYADPGRGQGLKGIRGYVYRFDGKLSVRSGTARIAMVPDWDDDPPREDGLSSFPGAQLQITIPKRVRQP